MKTSLELIQGRTFVFREPTYGELKAARALESLEAEEYLCNICTTYPRNVDWDSLPAGIPSVLARKIFELAGLTPERIAEREMAIREWAQSMEGKEEILMMVILGYTPEQIDNFDSDTLSRATTAASLGAIIQGYGPMVQQLLGDQRQSNVQAPVVQAGGGQEVTTGGFTSSRISI